MALVMLGSVIAFSAVFLGPWGALKSAAFAIGSRAWLTYAFGFLALTLGFVPGLFAWIAFTVSFAFPKFSFVLSVLSDPFGWGWNLFGTANSNWSPDITSTGALLQGALLLIGLIWSAHTALRNTETRLGDATKALPLIGFHLAFTLVMLWLLIA